MRLGGVEFVDLRREGERWFALPVENVDGIAIHHSVSDLDVRADNDLDGIQQILAWHTDDNGWPGIGYHVIIGDDGTRYLVGYLDTQRAGVWGENQHLWHICLLGSYMHVEPPPAQITGTALAIQALRLERERLAV